MRTFSRLRQIGMKGTLLRYDNSTRALGVASSNKLGWIFQPFFVSALVHHGRLNGRSLWHPRPHPESEQREKDGTEQDGKSGKGHYIYIMYNSGVRSHDSLRKAKNRTLLQLSYFLDCKSVFPCFSLLRRL